MLSAVAKVVKSLGGHGEESTDVAQLAADLIGMQGQLNTLTARFDEIHSQEEPLERSQDQNVAELASRLQQLEEKVETLSSQILALTQANLAPQILSTGQINDFLLEKTVWALATQLRPHIVREVIDQYSGLGHNGARQIICDADGRIDPTIAAYVIQSWELYLGLLTADQVTVFYRHFATTPEGRMTGKRLKKLLEQELADKVHAEAEAIPAD